MEELAVLDRDTRRRALESVINDYVEEGFHVINQTETTAQMQKEKDFSCLLFILLLALGIIPGIIYIVARKDKHAYITVDEFGDTTTTIDYEDSATTTTAIILAVVAIMILYAIFS